MSHRLDRRSSYWEKPTMLAIVKPKGVWTWNLILATLDANTLKDATNRANPHKRSGYARTRSWGSIAAQHAVQHGKTRVGKVGADLDDGCVELGIFKTVDTVSIVRKIRAGFTNCRERISSRLYQAILEKGAPNLASTNSKEAILEVPQ